MFIGHYGVALGVKKINNALSLGTLFLAAQFIDLLWPVFLLIGIEKVKVEPGNTAFTPLNFVSYPFSHSLFFVLIWAILFGLVYFLIKKNLKNSLLLGGLVLSHWFLDLFVHHPDLQILPWNSFRVGFGLWNSVILTVIIEGLIFIAGSYLFIISTKALNKKGSIGLWGLLIFLSVIYIINILSAPPPSESAIAIAGLFLWLIVAWAYWVDKNRVRTIVNSD
jgi:drug/metabolite transporter superfamily protein YnfA